MSVVLVVEDDEQVRVLAESVLQTAGHEAICATGVEGCVALLKSDKPVDVLFIDLVLGADPEAGLKVAQEAKAMRPNLAILYTTGGGVNEGTKALFVKPSLFLPKPYTVEQLTKSIAFLLLNSGPRPKAAIPSL